MIRRCRVPRLLLLPAIALLLNCGAPPPQDEAAAPPPPPPPAPMPEAAAVDTTGLVYLQCNPLPDKPEPVVRHRVTGRDTTLGVRDHELRIRPGSVPAGALLSMYEDTTRRVGIRVVLESESGEAMQFTGPVGVVISIQRCGNVDTAEWSIWRIHDGVADSLRTEFRGRRAHAESELHSGFIIARTP
jgi:hypothetical protein